MSNSRQHASLVHQGSPGNNSPQPTPQGMQRIDVPFMTAMRVQVSREVDAVKRGALAEARLMGEDLFFSWEVKTKEGTAEIVGITIDGAMMLLRQWGNAVALPEIVEQTADSYIFRGTFIDLQSGSTFARLYRKSRTTAPSRYAKTADGRQRWSDMQFSDGQSRVLRNVITDALPGWLVKACIHAARKAAAEGLNAEKERRAIVVRAKKLKLEPGMLQRKLGKPINEWNADDCVNMRAMLRTIQEGYAAIEDIFGTGGDVQSVRERTDLCEQYAARLRASISYEDGRAIGELINQAAQERRLTQDDVAELKKIFAEVVSPMKPKDAPPSQPEQDEQPPSQPAAAPQDEPKDAPPQAREPGEDDE